MYAENLKLDMVYENLNGYNETCINNLYIAIKGPLKRKNKNLHNIQPVVTL